MIFQYKRSLVIEAKSTDRSIQFIDYTQPFPTKHNMKQYNYRLQTTIINYSGAVCFLKIYICASYLVNATSI